MKSRTGLLFAIGAAAFYALGAGWGVPSGTSDMAVRKWGVDDETPLGPLAQVHNIIEPKEVQNLGYPLMHSFMASGAYAPYLGWKWVTGGWGAPSGELRFKSGAVRSEIGNSAEILRYLWGRYSAELGSRAAHLEPTPQLERAMRCTTVLSRVAVSR